MNKFKVNDKVKYINPQVTLHEQIGTITKILDESSSVVEFDLSAQAFIAVMSNKVLKKLPTIIKRKSRLS